MKIITLSFDDGEIFDIRLAKLLKKYGLKATFYLCSSHLGLEGELVSGRKYKKVRAEDLADAYRGFELGSHGASHRGFTKLTEKELLESIQADIKTFSVYTDKPIICCAYPGGETNEEVVGILTQNTPVMFARTTCRAGSVFAAPQNPYYCVPTVHLFDENIENIMDAFDALSTDGLHILHIYAHSWEIEWQRENGWETCEKIFDKLSKIKDAVFLDNGDTYRKVFERGNSI